MSCCLIAAQLAKKAYCITQSLSPLGYIGKQMQSMSGPGYGIWDGSFVPKNHQQSFLRTPGRMCRNSFDTFAMAPQHWEACGNFHGFSQSGGGEGLPTVGRSAGNINIWGRASCHLNVRGVNSTSILCGKCMATRRYGRSSICRSRYTPKPQSVCGYS